MTFGPIFGAAQLPESYAEYDFTLAASDSFNRADGAPGNTDGAGIDGVTGGSGLAWTDRVGTSTITTNRLRFSAVVANVGITTVDTGKTDGVICAKVNTTGSGGIVARYIDADNHIRAYYTGGNAVAVVQRLAGTPTTLLNVLVAYVADAELVVRLDGLRISMEYNGTYIGSATINVAFAAATSHGVYVNAAASTFNFDEWHFINLPSYASVQSPSIVQVLVGEYLITTPVRNDTTRFSEYDIRHEKTTVAGYAFTSNVRHLFGIDLVTIATGAKSTVGNGQGWESAGLIGADADLVGDYGYFGSIHQSEQLQAFTLSLSGAASLPRWKRVYCRWIAIDQAINTIYPKDKTTVIGTTTMRHYFTGDTLSVMRLHTYSAGYQIYGWYAAMMNVDNPYVDWYKVGDEAAAAMVLDDGAKNLGTETSYYRAWLNGGDFTVVMHLPTGGPDNSGDWSKSGNFKGWFKDNATSPQKFYANYVDSDFADRVAAVASQHTVQYWVENR